ncbi:MAG: energy transducer TonB [Thermodesulfobacteriota bacterium]
MNRIFIPLSLSFSIHIFLFFLIPDFYSAKKAVPTPKYLTITLSSAASPPAPQLQSVPSFKNFRKEKTKTIQDPVTPAPETEKIQTPAPEVEPVKTAPSEIKPGNSDSVAPAPQSDPPALKPASTVSIPPLSRPVLIREATPAYLKNPPPEYPGIARRRNIQGTVILEVKVNIDGTVGELRLFQSSGHSILDKAAMNSIRKWIFEPGMKGDEPIPMWVRVPIRFRLE